MWRKATVEEKEKIVKDELIKCKLRIFSTFLILLILALGTITIIAINHHYKKNSYAEDILEEISTPEIQFIIPDDEKNTEDLFSYDEIMSLYYGEDEEQIIDYTEDANDDSSSLGYKEDEKFTLQYSDITNDDNSLLYYGYMMYSGNEVHNADESDVVKAEKLAKEWARGVYSKYYILTVCIYAGFFLLFTMVIIWIYKSYSTANYEVCYVKCIGKKKYRHKYGSHCKISIKFEDGSVLEDISVVDHVYCSAKHDDTLMAARIENSGSDFILYTCNDK